jgi:RNA polymerase sigma-70 factor (ECF subfamily)
MAVDESLVTRPTLLVRVRDTSDQTAWARFVDAYTPMVFGFCRKRGLQPADAADVAQDVMRAVAAALPNFRYEPERGRFRDWLFRVTRSKLSSFTRARARQPVGSGETAVHEVLQAQPDADGREAWERDWQRHVFDWAASVVREECEPATWQAFWATAVEGRAAKEVAEELGMTTGAVYVARCRVLSRIRAAVGQVDD